MEDVTHSHTVSLLYKLISSAKDSDDLSTRFDMKRARRRDELTNNKKIKIKYHLRNILKDVFVFVEGQEKATYRLGYKKPITRNKDEAVLDTAAGIADTRIKIDHIHCYIPHYTPSIQQQSILSKHFSSRKPTEFR